MGLAVYNVRCRQVRIDVNEMEIEKLKLCEVKHVLEQMASFATIG